MVHIFLLWDVSSIVFCTQRRGSWHDYWGSRVESVVPDFKPKAWWDFLLETPGREMTITGESDFSPGLSSSTTLVQPTYFLWETAVTVIVCFWLWCLAFSSVSGFHLYSSLGLFGVWGFPSVSHVREGTMLVIVGHWCTLTVLNLPGCRQQAVRTEVVPNPFLLIKSSRRRSYLV